jgi:6-pyruvoyltetrahydropterin/6-carboxytetrahydropterin synthase
MIISKRIDIDTGHRVPFHKGKCRSFHGHRYEIEVFVNDKLVDKKGDSSEGMVIDYGDLKMLMLAVIDKPLDHSSIYYEKDPAIKELRALEKFSEKPFVYVPFIPTAENIAKYLFENMKFVLDQEGIKIHSVKVWETATSSAIYQN